MPESGNTMSESATAEPVLFELLTPHIALVTLNRPEKRNAINPAIADAMEAIVRRVEETPIPASPKCSVREPIWLP